MKRTNEKRLSALAKARAEQSKVNIVAASDDRASLHFTAVEAALRASANPTKAAFFPKFFRAGPGEYGEGDRFLGVVVPQQRKVAKACRALPLGEVTKLLQSEFHECRLTALFILCLQFEKAKSDAERKSIYDFYITHVDRVNNWDLVDTTCHKIMGPYLFERDRAILFRFAKAKHLWKNRIAIVTTYFFIRRGDLDTTFELSQVLLSHPHDLIHKAVGWMLREAGKQDERRLLLFLQQHYSAMPRTMLRYSIEKLPERQRKAILAGEPSGFE